MKTSVTISKAFLKGKISPLLFGSFLEHMGRVIYTGAYEPGHPDADEEGFRQDVLRSVKEMGVSLVRYPGGNFVSNYHWEDGVGPKEKRPRKLELAWKSIETNQFGTDEFMRWCEKADATPLLAVNLGTRGLEEAVHYLEYCNFPGGTMYSDMRRENGREKPYGVKYWCLGNEMDGSWQIGHKEACEYGRIAAETGKAMKTLDPDIKLIASGSSLSTMLTFPKWDMTVLERAYEVIDYLSLHQYYGNQDKGTEYFLAQSIDMERYIETIRSAVNVMQRTKRASHKVGLAMDEWGVWAKPSESVNEELREDPWRIAPAISEQIYTLEDALLFSSMMLAMLKNADVVKIACQSLLVNISACLMTEKGGECWRQTIYYPFFCIANHAKGTVLRTVCEGPSYACEIDEKVPYLDTAAVWNESEREVALFFVNRSEMEEHEVQISLEGFDPEGVLESVALTSSDKHATNRTDHGAVVLERNENHKLEGKTVSVLLPPMSFQMLRIQV